MDTPNRPACVAPYSTRDGVVLLVILAMLAALALLGIAFTTFSAQEQQSSTNFVRRYQTPRVDLDPNSVMVVALGQLIADTDNPFSAIRSHSLLVDMYGAGNDISVGPDGKPGRAGVDDDNMNGIDDPGELGWPGSDDRSGRLEASEYYRGAFSGPGDRALFAPLNAGPDGVLGTADDCFDVNFVWNNRVPNPKTGAFAGGFNEDYDYPDRQNMFLGLLRADGTLIVPSFHRPGVGAVYAGGLRYDTDFTAALSNAPLSPSRPDQRGRLKALRPRGGTGTENPLFPPFYKPGPDGKPGKAGVDDDGDGTTDNQSELGWPGTDDTVADVDNDGDGIPDSVWLDLGFPVQTTLDGRKFKPLFAFLVVDLDGKLNINAHGALANSGTTPASHADLDSASDPLGSGWSVGEVALQNVFKDLTALPATTAQSGVNANEYLWLLAGRAAGGTVPADISGRYGEPDLLASGTYSPRAGVTYRSTTAPTPGTAPVMGDDNAPSVPATAPYWAFNSRGNWNEGLRAVYGTDFNINSTLVPLKNGRYATPPDFDGNGSLQVDANGVFIYGNAGPSMGWGGPATGWPNPMMIYTGHSTAYENVDEQAEVNLYNPSGADAIFTTEDLEFLYRQNDIDGSSLVSRLFWLTPSLSPSSAAAARRRMMLTTESWSLNRFSMFPLTQGGPMPLGSPDLLNLSIETCTGVTGRGTPLNAPWGTPLNGPTGHGVFNVITYGSGGFMNLPAPRNTATAPGIVTSGGNIGLPLEIARGRRLDINRGYGSTITTTGSPYYRTAVPHPNTPGMSDPRTLARDIYLLLRQLCPADPTNAVDVERIRQMAQFAVNVVDFRDPDSIMTGFEYTIDLTVDADGDGKPDGWSVDGDLTTDEGSNRGLVWGVEAPQVIINETYSYEDPANMGKPQLWFELYNPQHPDPTDNAFRVNLRGNSNSQSAFQVILANRQTNPPDPKTGEPTRNATNPLDRRLEFDTSPSHTHPNPDADGSAVGGTGATIIDPDRYYLVGPKVANGATFTPIPDFDVPENTFTPRVNNQVNELGPGQLRLYLRRLADPTNEHDPGPDGVDGTNDDINPYITIDALDVTSHAHNPLAPAPHPSMERVDLYSVQALDYDTRKPQPHHSLKMVNDQSLYLKVGHFNPLYFNNRPFANPMELLLVPGVRPQWLTSAFVAPNAIFSPYAPLAGQFRTPAGILTGEPGKPSAPFLDAPYYLKGHLVNFFREDPGIVGSPSNYPVPGLYRLLEFVEVPSRMEGYREPNFNPNVADTRTDRVPGMMNVNTALEEEQLLGMFNNHPLALGGIGSFTLPPGTAARLPGTPTGPPGTKSTAVAYPGSPAPRSELFRRFYDSLVGADGIMGTADDQPVRSLTVGVATTRYGTAPVQPTSIANTLLRPWPMPAMPTISAGSPISGGRMGPITAEAPLFLDSRNVAPPGGPAGAVNLLGYPNFELQPLLKAGNVASTHSNVFAVWITVGFFEVPAISAVNSSKSGDDPTRLSQYGIAVAPPELGAEVNADIHQNIRHRGFFIIDRSRARGYSGPPRSSAELQDIFSQVLIHSRIIE